MEERIAKGLPYPVSDADPEHSEFSSLVKGDNMRDKRCIHLPDPHKTYDIYLSVLRGGHALGDVLERDPAAIADDLNQGYLLPRFAESTYGAIASQDAEGTWHVDAEATTKRRAEIRKERLARSESVEQWQANQRLMVEKKEFIEPVRQMYSESMALSTSWAEHFRTFWGMPENWSL